MQIMSEHDDVLLLCEDDVEIRNYEHFKQAISELPSDWELCYLGANVIGPVERYSEHHFTETERFDVFPGELFFFGVSVVGCACLMKSFSLHTFMAFMISSLLRIKEFST